MNAFARGLGASTSIALGYIPVAISFGLAAIQLGMSPAIAVAFSVLVYAGASQFVLIALLAAANANWLMIVGIIWLMNLRHVFYGPALLSAAQPCQRRYPLYLWAAGLTDEVFATAVGRLGQQAERDKEAWYMGLQVGAYSAWVGGTAVGAYFAAGWIGQWLILDRSLAFVLPALFISLLLEIAKETPNFVLFIAAIATVISLMFLPSYLAIIVGMLSAVLSTVMIKHGN